MKKATYLFFLCLHIILLEGCKKQIERSFFMGMKEKYFFENYTDKSLLKECNEFGLSKKSKEINGKNYYELSNSIEGFLINGYLRMENNQVFIIPFVNGEAGQKSENEQLLFDFNDQKGNKHEIHYGERNNYVIKFIDKIYSPSYSDTIFFFSYFNIIPSETSDISNKIIGLSKKNGVEFYKIIYSEGGTLTINFYDNSSIKTTTKINK